MKLVDKKKITLNGIEYYLSVKKTQFFMDKLCFLNDWKYKAKIYMKTSLGYKQLFKYKCDANFYKCDIDNFINDILQEFRQYLKETKYINDSSERIIIDEEWKEMIYNELYERVIEDLEKNGLLKL